MLVLGEMLKKNVILKDGNCVYKTNSKLFKPSIEELLEFCFDYGYFSSISEGWFIFTPDKGLDPELAINASKASNYDNFLSIALKIAKYLKGDK